MSLWNSIKPPLIGDFPWDFPYLNPMKAPCFSSKGMDSPCKPPGQASIPMYGAGGVDPTTHATLVAERDAGHGPTDALFGSLEDIPRGAARQMDGSIYNQEKRLELPSEKYGKGHGSAFSMDLVLLGKSRPETAVLLLLNMGVSWCSRTCSLNTNPLRLRCRPLP